MADTQLGLHSLTVPTVTPLQALRLAGELLAEALPKAPMYIVRRFQQKLQNRR